MSVVDQGNGEDDDDPLPRFPTDWDTLMEDIPSDCQVSSPTGSCSNSSTLNGLGLSFNFWTIGNTPGNSPRSEGRRRSSETCRTERHRSSALRFTFSKDHWSPLRHAHFTSPELPQRRGSHGASLEQVATAIYDRTSLGCLCLFVCAMTPVAPCPENPALVNSSFFLVALLVQVHLTTVGRVCIRVLCSVVL